MKFTHEKFCSACDTARYCPLISSQCWCFGSDLISLYLFRREVISQLMFLQTTDVTGLLTTLHFHKTSYPVQVTLSWPVTLRDWQGDGEGCRRECWWASDHSSRLWVQTFANEKPLRIFKDNFQIELVATKTVWRGVEHLLSSVAMKAGILSRNMIHPNPNAVWNIDWNVSVICRNVHWWHLFWQLFCEDTTLNGLFTCFKLVVLNQEPRTP